MSTSAVSPLKSPASTSSVISGQARLDLADRLRPVRGAAVGQVVAIDAGDHGVLAGRACDSASRHAARLVGIGGQRAAGRHVAELAAARADVAEDHDGQRAPVPALADVRARRRLAHRVQPEPVHEVAHVEVVLARRDAHLDPVGMAPPARRKRSPSLVMTGSFLNVRTYTPRWLQQHPHRLLEQLLRPRRAACAPSAPSMTRWSHDIVSVMRLRDRPRRAVLLDDDGALLGARRPRGSPPRAG